MNLLKLSRDGSPVPLYHQVKASFLDLFWSGRLKPGDVIPAEQQLCADLGVSRGTVRMAIGELVKDGILRREQGKGTFVASPRLENSLLRYFRFAEKDSSAAIVPESQILDIALIAPTIGVAQLLAISAKERVFKIKRLRTVKGSPFIYQVSFFPEKFFPGLKDIDRRTPSLYKLISERYGIPIIQVDEYLTAASPDYEARKSLGLKKESPVIVIERRAFSFNARPVEIRRSLGRADRYHYRIRL